MGGAGTVGVAVVVAVTGSVAGGGGVGAVEDDGDVAVAAVVVETVDFGEHRAPEKAGTSYEKGGVGYAVDNGSVGNNLDGRTVEEDVVVLVAERCDE